MELLLNLNAINDTVEGNLNLIGAVRIFVYFSNQLLEGVAQRYVPCK
jgi:hypothetical protein